MTGFPRNASPSLTAIEYERLAYPVNVADGHAKLSPAPGLEGTLSLNSLSVSHQRDLERDFLEEFTKYGHFCDDRFQYLQNSWLVPSASLAIDAVMKYLASVGTRSLGIIEPTFDNIPALARRSGLNLTAIIEAEEFSDDVADLDAVFLVIPNNPTGWNPGRHGLAKLFRQLAEQQRLLVIDRTFRFFGDPDFLEALLMSTDGLRWITIDDTGKTWSTLENKVSVVSASDIGIMDEVRMIGEEITLNVSPIALALCTNAMRLENGPERILRTVAVNRSLLERQVRENCHDLVRVVPSRMSVATMLLNPGLGITGDEFATRLSEKGVGVLPGRQFYWSSPQRGEMMIRIALARDLQIFENAAIAISGIASQVMALQ